MSQRLQAATAEIATLSATVSGIWDKAGDDALDEKTKQEVITANKRIEELEHEVKELQDQQQLRAQAQQRQERYNQPATSRLATPNSGKRETPGEQAARALSLGERVLGDAEFKAWHESLVRNGHIPERARIHSPGVPIAGGLKTLITGASATSAGALVNPALLGLLDTGTFQRPLTIRSLITTGTTASDAIDYVLMGTPTNNAAVVAEATATSGASGAKPESAMALSTATTTVKTIAHWIPITRRALADAPQVRSMIDSFLLYGLDEELEDQILNGDGVGENFTGITNTSGTQTQAWDTDLLTTTRKARTKVRVTGRAQPSAYLMHPNDWERLDLLQDNEARYFFGGPSVLGNARLWGLPVVESEAQVEGAGICADWRWAMLWDREQANILISDSHADFFIRNLLAILAELRAAFTVIRPAAFVEIDLTA
jgi:HK97 family phage major capsid protein